MAEKLTSKSGELISEIENKEKPESLKNLKESIVNNTLEEIKEESGEVLVEDLYLEGIHKSYDYLKKIAQLSKIDTYSVDSLLKLNPEATMSAEFVLLYELGYFKGVDNVARVETDDGFGILLQGEQENEIITVNDQTLLDEAVRQFQSAHQIMADGIVGPQTLSVLLEEYNNKQK